MLPTKLEFRHWINITFTLTLLATIYYFLNTPPQTETTTIQNPGQPIKEYSVCDKVDIPWL